MRLVSLSGPKGSGKNALADLVDRHSNRCVRVLAFADPIRWACDALGLPRSATRERKEERGACGALDGATGREMMIAIGEGVRSVAPDYFADHMRTRLSAIAEEGARAAIVTDARRANEMDALALWAEAGGHQLARLWIARPGHDADEVLERSIRPRCVTITNDGGLADLSVKAAAIAEWLDGGGGRGIGGPL